MTTYDLNILDLGDQLAPVDSNVDMEVTLADGSRWTQPSSRWPTCRPSSRRTVRQVRCRDGLYLFATALILVQRLDERTIKETVDRLLETGEFDDAFGGLEP